MVRLSLKQQVHSKIGYLQFRSLNFKKERDSLYSDFKGI